MIELAFVYTSDLSGDALDWAVAKCEGWKYNDRTKIKEFQMQQISSAKHCYSRVWAKGGPIIEREEIGLKRNAPCSDGRQWEASPSITAKGAGGRYGYGPTPLIAAMRCYVASKLGNEVDIPIELMEKEQSHETTRA